MARKTKRQDKLTDEELKLINEDNMELMNDFLDYLQSIDKSMKTINKYKSDLHIVLNWFRIRLKNKLFVDIKKNDVVKFQGWCVKEEMSPARIRSLRSAMSSMSNYIENIRDEEFENFRNIINKIPAPALKPVREKTILTEGQIEKLLKHLIDNNKIQQACCVAIVSASGMRISELIQCKYDWYFGDKVVLSDGMYVSPEIRTKGFGSLGKSLNKFTIKELAEVYLLLWDDKRKELGIENDSLFVVKRNGKYVPAKESTIRSWMDLYTKILEVDVYPHSFRHYTGTWLKKNNVPIDMIRDFFGHNDSSTTEIYIDVEPMDNLKGMLSFMGKNK